MTSASITQVVVLGSWFFFYSVSLPSISPDSRLVADHVHSARHEALRMDGWADGDEWQLMSFAAGWCGHVHMGNFALICRLRNRLCP